MKNYGKLIISSILAGILISTFAGVSNIVNEPHIGPLVFMIGIMLIMVNQLNLITKDCPTGSFGVSLFVVLFFNIVGAAFTGLFFSGHMPQPVVMKIDLFQSVLTGIIIGFVAWVNRKPNRYTIYLTIALMYAFVYCKLPHCVVYGFYFPNSTLPIDYRCYGLSYAIIGNIIGGIMVYLFYKLTDYLNTDKQEKVSLNE